MSVYKEIQSFKFGSDVWFSSEDVCELLGYPRSDWLKVVSKYTNHANVMYLSFFTKARTTDCDTWYLNDFGFYDLCIKCELDKCKLWKRYAVSIIRNLKKYGIDDISSCMIVDVKKFSEMC